ncbi:N-6 DNA methylase [Burkholderia pseudomallei]|uniref:N-6 DNA methylase n=1 Tax=Burkholderia pseudomallei TaxID=28450 RepID=UPI000F07737D|nr:N-6 DNA methylase [Burkholderia pseudomallei]CAJ3075541.1 Type I restriction-modification system methyltransferase subunit [Burkholderia pseudomallei]VCK72585.1 Type I restriction-modification system methyltransferase subunit [Burkholderia pseudomallei]VCK79894.1 Type I restriction-modification system methyltransferase subunit [Burkholderia pseudomallei]VCK80109.1 Type I restriction-modification system methyltransferase subunit [Burkholderia pseudomallei]VCK80688.1 Type I restriction-modifi
MSIGKTAQQTFIENVVRFSNRSPLSNGAKDVLDDLAQLHFNLLSQIAPLAYPNGAVWVDPMFLVELNKYRGHAALWNDLQQLAVELSHLIRSSAPFTDLLGDAICGAVSEQKATALGQFFTPPQLAATLLQFLEPSEAQTLRVGDPCCGAGALALAQLADLLKSGGKEAIAGVHVVLNDKDPGMAKLAAAQVGLSALFHGIPLGGLDVHCGDVIADYLNDTLILHIAPDAEKRMPEAG